MSDWLYPTIGGVLPPPGEERVTDPELVIFYEEVPEGAVTSAVLTDCQSGTIFDLQSSPSLEQIIADMRVAGEDESWICWQQHFLNSSLKIAVPIRIGSGNLSRNHLPHKLFKNISGSTRHRPVSSSGLYL